VSKFEMCEDCKRDAGTMNLYRLCCATRRVMNHALATLPLREQYARRTAIQFGHEYDDMRTMAGEIRAYRKGKAQ